MRGLMRESGRLGVRVYLAHLDDRPDLRGYYSHSRKVIVIRLGLTPVERDCVFAHELGHAFYGDECSRGANERRAERYAAELLITPEAYAAAEMIDASVEGLAEALDVSADLVRAYREHSLIRLGSRTYGRRWDHGLQGDRSRQLSN
jgi:Zn-dependent peptidase ImmA (M78 family)